MYVYYKQKVYFFKEKDKISVTTVYLLLFWQKLVLEYKNNY